MKLFVALVLFSLPLAAADIGSARKLVAEGRFADAKPQLERIAEGDPENAEAQLLLARCQRATGDNKAALDSFERARELSPKDVGLLYEYGSYCLERSGPEKSLGLSRKGCELLESLIEKVPAHAGAREWLIGFYRGAPWIAGGSMKKAQAHAEALAAQDPERSLELRVSLKLQDGKADEALVLAEAALSKEQPSYMQLYVFAQAAAATPSRIQDAKTSLEKCLKLETPKGRPGHDEVHRVLAQISLQQGDKNEARKQCEAGLSVNQANKALLRLLAGLK